VKGADYGPGQVVGAAEVEGAGGRVVRVALVPDQSSTSVVERARAPS